MPPAVPTGIVWQVRRLPEVDSTNRVLLEQARAGAPEGRVVVAEHQTAGRGRLGRTWSAAPGSSLLVSVLLRPQIAAEHLPTVAMAAGLALSEAVERVAGFAPGLKWPNDLVVRDRKLAGILTETDAAAGRVAAVVVGAGCNVTAASFPPELAPTATACDLEAGHPVPRAALLDAYLDRLRVRLVDSERTSADYCSRLATLGRHVRVDLVDGSTCIGWARAVDDVGALVVERDDGTAVTITVGDVVHLRS
jgi:BirA family biotin operon repressor/biotin-[acetyl-CoA-carboxylase] ligase